MTIMCAAKQRLSKEERKKQIIESVLPLFAKQGFKGTTTKELAEVSGVSEALLYQHFPSKEAIYKELPKVCCTTSQIIEEQIQNLKPSTLTLVQIIYLLVSGISLGHPGEEPGQHLKVKRLIMYSLLESGNFARMFIESKVEIWRPKLEQCYQAAVESDDIVSPPGEAFDVLWLAHHLAFGISALLVSPQEVIDHNEKDRQKFTHQAVWFALRGIGLKDAAIEKYYDPKAFLLLGQSNWT